MICKKSFIYRDRVALYTRSRGLYADPILRRVSDYIALAALLGIQFAVGVRSVCWRCSFSLLTVFVQFAGGCLRAVIRFAAAHSFSLLTRIRSVCWCSAPWRLLSPATLVALVIRWSALLLPGDSEFVLYPTSTLSCQQKYQCG